MSKKKLYCVVDVESAGDLGFPLIYDFAWKIVDKHGNVYAKQNYLVKEIFTDMKLMCKAYYADKYFSIYPQLISEGLQIKSLYEIISLFEKDWNDCGVTTFCAYNSGFDLTAMLCTYIHCAKYNGLQKAWPKMKFREEVSSEEFVCLQSNFAQFANYLDASDDLDKGIRELKHKVCFDTEILDIYLLCAERLMATKRFTKTALENLWLTPNGNFSTTAECAWRYFSGEYDFIEHHTSMEDVEIEATLLVEMLKQKKKLPINQLHPACIVSRAAQPNNQFFHERHKRTWTDFLDESFLQTLGFGWEDFQAMNNFDKWKVILKNSFMDMPISEHQRKILSDKFLSVTGMNWKEWQQLPQNFQKRLLIELYDGEWYLSPYTKKTEQLEMAI